MCALVFEVRPGHLPVAILDSLLGPSDLVDLLTDAIVGVSRENLIQVRWCGPERWRGGRREKLEESTSGCLIHCRNWPAPLPT